LQATTQVKGSLSENIGLLDLVHIGIILSTDETSGNLSKHWNHFENVFMHIANLPSELNHPDHYRLVATGCQISWKDIGEVAIKEFEPGKPLSTGFKVWDSSQKKMIVVIGSLLALICDNPWASQICSVVQSSGSRSCRFCDNDNSNYVFTKGLSLILSMYVCTYTYHIYNII
jgi:hypothetical protein